jgi:putative SOS response-associated peptidase YedK
VCGRYGRRADKQRIAEWFRTHNTNVFSDRELGPTYNAAPQSLQPVIRLNSETGEREIAIMKWGLVPYWIPLANSIQFCFYEIERIRWTRYLPHEVLVVSGARRWSRPRSELNCSPN